MNMYSIIKNFLLCLMIGITIGFNNGDKELYISNVDNFSVYNIGFFVNKFSYYQLFYKGKKVGHIDYNKVKYIYITKDNENEKKIQKTFK